MSARINRTSIGTVIFVGIVDYGQLPVDDQIALKERFNAVINAAVQEVPPNDRIILDTGEGAALAMLGAPEDALAVALNIRQSVLHERETHAERAVSVRIGINLGPVRVVNDLNGRLNVVGDGINAAQRVMSFAQPNRILVSRSYYDIASRLSTELAGMFRYQGVMTDKFVREHEVYSVVDGGVDETTPDDVDAVSPEFSSARAILPFLALSKVLPAVGVAAALVLAWGYGTTPAPSETALSTAPSTPGQGAATLVDMTAKAAPAAGDSKEKAASHPRPRSADETRQASQEKAADSARRKEAGADRSTGALPTHKPRPPKPNPLCSDAQRMLKQC